MSSVMTQFLFFPEDTTLFLERKIIADPAVYGEVTLQKLFLQNINVTFESNQTQFDILEIQKNKGQIKSTWWQIVFILNKHLK